MNKFIYVFEEEAAKDLKQKGYVLLKQDEKNKIWVFANLDPDNLTFSCPYKFVLSSVLPF